MVERKRKLRFQNQNDLGFGTAANSGRNMNKDGSFNVERTGEPRFRPYEIYHNLITMSWTRFILLVLTGYVLANLLFACIYYFVGVEHLTMGEAGLKEVAQMSEGRKFMEVFFFSSQTLTTLGYGRVAPVGATASSIAAIESMIGLLGFALATGILYGRFSRPEAKILFSHNILISPYRGGIGLMFRTANMRRNQLIETEIEVNVGYTIPEEGRRGFVTLGLERSKISLFPTSWTLVHPIDENSIFYGMSIEEIREMKPEIFVIMKAFDDTFSQTIYARTSYRADEIISGAKFLPMFHQLENGKTLLDLRLINAMEKVELPVMAIKELE